MHGLPNLRIRFEDCRDNELTSAKPMVSCSYSAAKLAAYSEEKEAEDGCREQTLDN
jgi:hypothetical protein